MSSSRRQAGLNKSRALEADPATPSEEPEGGFFTHLSAFLKVDRFDLPRVRHCAAPNHGDPGRGQLQPTHLMALMMVGLKKMALMIHPWLPPTHRLHLIPIPHHLALQSPTEEYRRMA